MGAQPPDPRASGGWGFAPKPPASGGWGLCPQTPNTAPHCEFLATRLPASMYSFVLVYLKMVLFYEFMVFLAS